MTTFSSECLRGLQHPLKGLDSPATAPFSFSKSSNFLLSFLPSLPGSLWFPSLPPFLFFSVLFFWDRISCGPDGPWTWCIAEAVFDSLWARLKFWDYRHGPPMLPDFTAVISDIFFYFTWNDIDKQSLAGCSLHLLRVVLSGKSCLTVPSSQDCFSPRSMAGTVVRWTVEYHGTIE